MNTDRFGKDGLNGRSPDGRAKDRPLRDWEDKRFWEKGIRENG